MIAPATHNIPVALYCLLLKLIGIPMILFEGQMCFLPKYCSEMNPIELEWQHIKKDELAGQMFEDELDLAYAVIQGVEVRGERGNYRTQRVKFNSNAGS